MASVLPNTFASPPSNDDKGLGDFSSLFNLLGYNHKPPPSSSPSLHAHPSDGEGDGSGLGGLNLSLAYLASELNGCKTSITSLSSAPGASPPLTPDRRASSRLTDSTSDLGSTSEVDTLFDSPVHPCDAAAPFHDVAIKTETESLCETSYTSPDLYSASPPSPCSPTEKSLHDTPSLAPVPPIFWRNTARPTQSHGRRRRPSKPTLSSNFFEPMTNGRERSRSLQVKLVETFPEMMDGASGSQGDEPVYVFVDHSNILCGFLSYVKERRPDLFEKGARKNGCKRPRVRLDYHSLFNILHRARPIARRVLVASSPLYQPLDAASDVFGYECSVLKRVPKGGEVEYRNSPPLASSLPGSASKSTRTDAEYASFWSDDSDEEEFLGLSTQLVSARIRESGVTSLTTPPRSVPGRSNSPTHMYAAPPQYMARNSPHKAWLLSGGREDDSMNGRVGGGLDGGRGGRRSGRKVGAASWGWKEQAVDELLHLKILQTLLDASPFSSLSPGSSAFSGRADCVGRPTLLLATGDSAPSPYNSEGFYGCARRALEMGWNVEIVAWKEGGCGRAWEALRTEWEGEGVEDERAVDGVAKWGRGKMTIVGLEEFAEELSELA